MNFMEAMKSPKPQFSPAAFWFWYGELNPDTLRKQINMMVEQGVYNGFMHARAYLKTQYLEDDWWKAISACIDEGKKTGFYPWLYDEYAWPSGTAGSTFQYGYQKPSRTLSKGECNMAKYLSIKSYASKEELSKEASFENLVSAFYKDGENWVHTTNLSDWKGEVMAFYRNFTPRFVDYLNPETVKEFINCTHEEYKKRFGENFGNIVPGIFFDEIFMVGWMPWTEKFAEEFQKRCGYDIVSKLYVLRDAKGKDDLKVRNDYYEVVAQLYEEGFFVQISDWCKKNNLELTGHIEEHFERHPGRQGHFFNNERHLDIPGADCHDYRYRFPRKITYREPKFAVSTARAYGKKRMMSEAFGGAGWGCSLQQYKRGMNTLGAMGINMVTLHGFYTECVSQGEQADWPCSFFFQNPYWRYFKHLANYMNRICYMNTQGTPVVEVGLYYPIEEMRKLTVDGLFFNGCETLNDAWNNAMNSLLEHQIDVDIIDEVSLLRATVKDGTISVGSQNFKVLVFPDIAEFSDELREKLDEFQKSGGKVIYYACEDGKDGAVKTEMLPKAVNNVLTPDVGVLFGERDNLFVNHRKIEDKEVYFIGSSTPRKRSLILNLREKGSVQKLSPDNGELSDVYSRITENGTEVRLSLEEDEACWLIVDANRAEKTLPEEYVAEEFVVAGKWEFLPIDSAIKDEKQLEINATELDIPLAAFSSEPHPDGRQIRIKNTENEDGFCGRHLSLWKANWITRRFDWVDISMKENLYCRKEFVLDEKPESARICLAAVNEWTMWINGQKVAESEDARTASFVDITEFLTAGKNLIAISVRNKTTMEHFNLLSLEYLRPEEMISLIAQAEIKVGDEFITIATDESWQVNEAYIEGWQQVSYCPEVHYRYSTNTPEFGDGDDKWSQAWKRGCPPMLPWGDMPLFGETVTYPQKISYSIVLPAGTSKIYYPDMSGRDIKVTVDGMAMPWKNGECFIKPDGNTHQMQISMVAENGKDGLHSNIKVQVIPFRHALCDWRLHGLKWYAGFTRYRNTMNLKKKPGRYILNLGKVSFQTEVWVNGVKAGEKVWEPYQLDITDFLRDGENDIVVIVSNSAAVERQYMLVDEGMALGWNRYWNDDNIQREGENLVSGLQGPIMLDRRSEI
ncbi:MAG: hypothetical protein E7406_00725 [Ruminococcaceae bacterium]|nr:hypothetical protein [Oscillospiraceae bacterium]